MPHLTLEYTANLGATRPADLLLRANRCLAASGLFAEADIKSRSVCLDDWYVGTESGARAFVHARLSLLRGRPIDVRRRLADMLLDDLRTAWPVPTDCAVQWCVEVSEIDGDTYAKEVT